MKKNRITKVKENVKGITLLVLVVTIVVLIILTSVTINLTFSQNGLLGRTKNAVNSYEIAGENESNAIKDIKAQLEQTDKDYNGKGIIVKVSTIKSNGTRVSNNTELTDDNGNKVWLPTGFKIAADSATDQDYGIVIEDADLNQWVWVPVSDASVMYDTIIATNLSGTTVDSAKSTMQSKSEIISGITRAGIGSTADCREPDILNNASYDTSSSYYNSELGFADVNAMGTAFVKDYTDMINSVKTYKGFYIGRYELNGTVASPTEKANQVALVNQDWYNLYKACRSLSKGSTNYTTTMIFGCQWDVTCNFIANQGEKKSITDSSSWGNYYNAEIKSSDGTTVLKGSGITATINTGVTTQTRANNIYDIAGNCMERTQEANYSVNRAVRGGDVADSNGSFAPAITRVYSWPTISNQYQSSRPTLYL